MPKVRGKIPFEAKKNETKCLPAREEKVNFFLKVRSKVIVRT